MRDLRSLLWVELLCDKKGDQHFFIIHPVLRVCLIPLPPWLLPFEAPLIGTLSFLLCATFDYSRAPWDGLVFLMLREMDPYLLCPWDRSPYDVVAYLESSFTFSACSLWSADSICLAWFICSRDLPSYLPLLARDKHSSCLVVIGLSS